MGKPPRGGRGGPWGRSEGGSCQLQFSVGGGREPFFGAYMSKEVLFVGCLERNLIPLEWIHEHLHMNQTWMHMEPAS